MDTCAFERGSCGEGRPSPCPLPAYRERVNPLVVVGTLLLLLAPVALGQQRPYIGFVYPAGGQQGTTVRVRIGGQQLDDPEQVFVSGPGVTARVVEYHRRYGAQEMQLMQEQLRLLKRGKPQEGSEEAKLVAKIEERVGEYSPRPASAAIATIAILEVKIDQDAAPGKRELVVTTGRGVSNPLAFHVGQLPETTRKAMYTAHFQVLGKERLALRKRPDDEAEKAVTLPCTVNGQIASGEVNKYRFEAKKGQKLVISSMARQLNPFVADAVPGWFQPVMKLTDAKGHEVAYNDDFRFKPDPVILCEVPKDGEYVLSVTDAIYRGREDFVYRIGLGELPFVTSIFPIGGQAGQANRVEMKGWNLQNARPGLPGADAAPGLFSVAAKRDGIVSNVLPFELGTLPEVVEAETNDQAAGAQKVALPVVVNGRINRADDADVFQFEGKAGQTVVVDVDARRLESPVDSFVRVTEASGAVLGFNDDQEDGEAGSNTHDADSYLTVKLPADGAYFVHVTDTSRAGGEEFAYRVRISEPRPDFALRVVPTSLSLRSKAAAQVTVHVFRKEGFTGPVQLTLKDAPAGFGAPVTNIPAGQSQVRLSVRADNVTKEPVDLVIQGHSKQGEDWPARTAVPAEDRMQAFLWRHLVPAESLKVLAFDATAELPPRRQARVRPTTTPATQPTTRAVATDPAKPKFTKQQVQQRLRQLKVLFEDGLLMEDFYQERVAECEAAM